MQRIDEEPGQSLPVDEITERPCEHEVDDERDAAPSKRARLRPEGREDARGSLVNSLGHGYGMAAS